MNNQAKEWHGKNKMPQNPSLEDRIKWAIRHEKNCGCRPISKNLLEEIKKRKLTITKNKITKL